MRFDKFTVKAQEAVQMYISDGASVRVTVKDGELNFS